MGGGVWIFCGITQYKSSLFNPLTPVCFCHIICFRFDIHTLNNISKVPFEVKVPIIVHISIQFNSIQFFIHTIQDIYISVHGRKIK